MKVGSLITTKLSGMYIYENIHGKLLKHIAPFDENEIGIVIDFGVTITDVPYSKILSSKGLMGWIRCNRIEVLQ